MAWLGWRGTSRAASTASATPTELPGPRIHLRIGETPVNLTGRERTAVTVNGTLPAPLLRWREGDTVTIDVENTLDEDTSIHWHGLLLPANMDGVPGLSFKGIPARGTFQYRFTLRQSGTYWYHSHSAFQEQLGLYGPIVIEPRDPEPLPVAHDYVVMLSDWTDERPATVLAHLKKDSGYYNFNKRTVVDFVRDVRREGLDAAVQDRLAWGRMRMTPTDLADVTGYTYTHLVNGHTSAQNWTGLFRRGERIRLRFINGSAASYYDVRIPG
ncbi:MAG: multicopper oxidase domain-containing protein, partial [Gammaproteobacteria bacterium]